MSATRCGSANMYYVGCMMLYAQYKACRTVLVVLYALLCMPCHMMNTKNSYVCKCLPRQHNAFNKTLTCLSGCRQVTERYERSDACLP